MPVSSHGYTGRQGGSAPRVRLTRARVFGLVLVLMGLVATVLSLVSAALR